MTDSLEREISTLRSLFWSDRDPDGRVFAPLADALRRRGDMRAAVVTLNEGLERLPAYTTGHVIAARIYLDSGLHAEAELSARRALELDRENVEAMGALIRALELRDALPEAREAREQLARIDPAMVEELGPAPEPEEPAAPEEEVVDLAALAPDEVEAPAVDEAEDEPVMELAALAPDEPEEEVVDLAALAPDEVEPPAVDEAEDEPVMELAALAPDEPEEDVVDLAALAPDEIEPPAVDAAGVTPEDEPYIRETAGDPIPTRTLADLYARQGLAGSALRVYRQLLVAAPGDEELRERVHALEAAAAEKGEEVEASAWDPDAQADEHEVDTPFAWTAEAEPAEGDPEDGPAIGDYFSELLDWDAEAEEP